MCVRPVIFPPGLARLATSPVETGSPVTMTIGMVAVASLAMRTAVVPLVRMRSTLSRTSSAAIAGSRSILPSAYRYSMLMFWPSIQPSSRSLFRNASSRSCTGATPCKYPMRASFPEGCASAPRAAVRTARPARKVRLSITESTHRRMEVRPYYASKKVSAASATGGYWPVSTGQRPQWSAMRTDRSWLTADVLRAEVNGRCRCPRPRPTYPLAAAIGPETDQAATFRTELSFPADNDARPVLRQLEFHFRRLSCAPGVRIADPIRVFLQSGLPAEIAYRHRHAAIEGDGRLHHFRHYPVENGHHRSFARPVRTIAKLLRRHHVRQMHPVLRPAFSRRPASDTKNILNCDTITRSTRDPAFDAGDPQGRASLSSGMCRCREPRPARLAGRPPAGRTGRQIWNRLSSKFPRLVAGSKLEFPQRGVASGSVL